MMETDKIFLGGNGQAQYLLLHQANRHGLIAGATGTGKTVSLQVLAEGFSEAGVPVFMADVKGDLSGISQPGGDHPKLRQRAEQVGLTDYSLRGYPTVCWDLFGQKGHPIRTTISEMGPLLLSRLLELNDAQEGVVNIAFRLADDDGLLLLDLKDFRAMLNFIAENSDEILRRYGNVSRTSVGAIQRRLLVLEQQGGGRFFGEPALQLSDFIRTGEDGLGCINLLAADELVQYPRMYATFLLWLLSELFEELPEVGDTAKPRLIFFFDEAHLLFTGAPRALIEKVEQVVRLIRSKGVGVFFVTQDPLDIPDTVLGQLGNRIQHALRAFTPRQQKAVRAAAATFRPNPDFKAEQAIAELGTGEALVSTLGDKGTPGMVQRTLMRPPGSRIGPVTSVEREALINGSVLRGRYDATIDRVSAYELLEERAAATAAGEQAGKQRRYDFPADEASRPQHRSSNRQSIFEAMAKSTVRSIGSALGRRIARGILGSVFKGR